MSTTMRGLCAVAFLLLGPATAKSQAPAEAKSNSPVSETPARAEEDDASFEHTTIKNFQRRMAVGDEDVGDKGLVLDFRSLGLRPTVEFSGKVRPIDPSRMTFLQRVALARGAPQMPTWFKREILVREQGSDYWIPFQEELMPALLEEVAPGDKLEVRLRYLGVRRPRNQHEYISVGFWAKDNSIPRSQCFTNSIAGVSLGAEMKATLSALQERLGKPERMTRGYRTYHVFEYGEKRQARLLIGNAGFGYDNRVFSVQLAGNPIENEPPFYESLRLGSSLEDIQKVFGGPLETADAGDGYVRVTLPNTHCSLEMVGGKLASVLLHEDPNYFSE